ncbi:MAG: CHAT domain-containing protein [Cytophagales bacterium]|nr:CHAT domain-containing protein [Cytophagales bacterium]
MIALSIVFKAGYSRKLLMIALVSVYSWLSIQSVAQSEYSDLGYQRDGILFYEPFRVNAKGYATAATDRYEKKIENGYYKLASLVENYIPEESFNKKGLFQTDKRRDFQIEVDMKYVAGRDNNANALLFGKATKKSASGFTSHFRFGFSGNGKITIDNYNADSRSFTDLLGWTVCEPLQPRNFNKFTVRKSGNKLYFFVNETLVHTADYSAFYDDNVGFMVNDGTEIHVKNLIVGYLTKKKGEQIQDLSAYRPKINEQAVQYTGYSYQEMLYKEDFSDNSQSWRAGTSDSRYFQIENGYYVIQSFKTGYYAAAKFNEENQFTIDQSRDFQIECKMKFVSGEDNNSNSLNWGQKSDDWSNLRFGFSGDGSFKVFSYDDAAENNWTNYQSWTESAALSKRDYNKMTVRKVADQYYFFINEILVTTVPFKPFFGQVLSVQSNQNTTIRVDDIIVSYIHSRGSSTPEVAVVAKESTKPEKEEKVAVEEAPKPEKPNKQVAATPKPVVKLSTNKYIQFVEDHPDYKQAMTAYDNKNYTLASSLFESLIKRYPDQAEIYLRAGLGQVQAENFDRAISYFDMAHLLNPTDISILTNLFIFKSALGQTTEAQKLATRAGRMMAQNQFDYYLSYANSWTGYFDYYNASLVPNINATISIFQQAYSQADHQYPEEVAGKIFVDLKNGGILKHAKELTKRLQAANQVMYDTGLPFSYSHYMLHYLNELLDEQYRRDDLSDDWKDWLADYQTNVVLKSMWYEEANDAVENPFLYCRFTDKKYAIMLQSGDVDNALALNTVRIEKAGSSPYLKFELINLYAERLILLANYQRLEQAREIAASLEQVLSQYTAPELLIKGYLALNNYYQFAGQMQKAIAYGHKAEAVSKESGYMEIISFIYNNLSLAYFRNDQRDKGIEYSLLSNEYAANDLLKAKNLTGLGVRLLHTEHQKAIDILTQAEEMYLDYIGAVSDYLAKSVYTSLYNSNVNLSLAHKYLNDDEAAFNAIERSKAKKLASDINSTIPDPITAKEVQALLSPGQVMLYYAEKLLEDGDVGFCMVAITKDKVKYQYINNVKAWVRIRNQYREDLALIERENANKELRVASFNVNPQSMRQKGDFNLMTELLRRSFKEEDRNKIADIGGSYYDAFIGLFIEEIEAKKELIIVPSGPLNFIPFEGLLSRSGRLLVEEYDISYVQSPTVLRELAGRNYQPSKSILAMGGAEYGKVNFSKERAPELVKNATDVERLKYETFNDIKGGAKSLRQRFYALGYAEMSYLQGTLKEVNNIQQIVPSAKSFLGTQMNETNLKNLSASGELDDYRVIHLATHGWVESYIPELSGFAMTVFPDEQNGEDGHVYLHEVEKLRIKADMVMLSACQTGLGKLQTGQGVAGLNQAFIASGANSTITSLWAVNDYATSVLVSELYRMVFNEKKSFRKALNEVKRGFITGKYNKDGIDLNNTSYWAPFIYYGKL